MSGRFVAAGVAVLVAAVGATAAPVPEARRGGDSGGDPLGAPMLGVVVGNMRVGRVGPGTAAARGGLAPGDLIVRVGGCHVREWGEVVESLGRHRPGARLPVEVLRAGRVVRVTLVLGAQSYTGMW
jgi:S1-C subfamily serine protease